MAKAHTAQAWPGIHTIRKAKVVLDADWAALSGVPTKRLNEAVRHNVSRFPSDFSFALLDAPPVDEAKKPKIGFPRGNP